MSFSDSGQASIRWTEEMSTGIPELDEQHHQLIVIIAQLSEALRHGRGEDEVRDTLASLADYAQRHFKLEELCMSNYSCPTARQNETAHERFLSNLEAFKERLDREGASADLARDVHSDLGLWLVNHILRTDVCLRSCVG